MVDNVAELTYFEGRGRAESIRFLLTVAAIPYREVYLKQREQYLALLPELPFGQVPLLRIDGLNIVQHGAIVRHVARKANLLGDTHTEHTRIDMLFEGACDFSAIFRKIILVEPEETVLAEIKEKTLPRYLPAFSKFLSESKTGFLVGSRLSLADVGLMEALLATVDYFGEQTLSAYPQLESYYRRLMADERVAKYVKQVRQPKNNESMVAAAKAVLSHMF